MRRTGLAVSVLLPVALSGALSAGCGGGEPKAGPPARPPVLVRVAAAGRMDVPFVARAPGLVLASETVGVHARIDSQVMEVHFREGDRVEAGELLFTLDDRAVSADLRRQEATLATGVAELNNARRQFERARKLAAGGFESTAELDKARADFEAAEARTVATRAEIERLQVLLGYTKIRAAIDGRAGAISATVGNTVKANDAGAPLVVINRVSPILVQFGLPQQLLAPLREQMAGGEVEARVIRDGVELPEHGRVVFIDNAIERATGSFEGRARFGNESEALWPGMIVEVVLPLGLDRDVIAVPEIAVQHASTGDFVFVIAEGVARRRPVVVRRYGEGLAVIAEGLSEVEQVATDGMLSLSEGTPVEIAGAKAAAVAPGGSKPPPGAPAKEPPSK